MHDKNGKPLEVGDRCTITGVIIALGEEGPFCNCTIKLDEPMPAYPDQKQTISALNTKMVEKVESPPQ